jgi:lactococcin 972 family bacteriocin
MKSLARAFATTAVVAGLLVVGTTSAQAATPPEGGTWNYGVTGKYTYSNYHHSSRIHKATACGVGCVTSGWIAPNYWASAQAISALGGNTAYYDVK